MAKSLTVRISRSAHEILSRLAEETGDTMQALLDKMLEEYRRKRFFNEANAAYAKMRQDPRQWAALEKERKAWDATLADGLDPDEVWQTDGRATVKKKRKK